MVDRQYMLVLFNFRLYISYLHTHVDAVGLHGMLLGKHVLVDRFPTE